MHRTGKVTRKFELEFKRKTVEETGTRRLCLVLADNNREERTGKKLKRNDSRKVKQIVTFFICTYTAK
jgi:hypothetical protein